MILVDLDRVSASRPGRPLFEDLSLTVSSKDQIGIVGINGTGKSTLLRVLTGDSEPDSGTVRRGRGVRISALVQTPGFGAGTLREELTRSEGSDHHETEPASGEWESLAIADRLGLSPHLDKSMSELSGGQQKRAALAQVLVTPSDLLILDEPTNHLDIDSIAWLEDRLAEHRGALVLVTHDRHFLDRVTNRIVELDRGKSFVHEGGYGSYLEGRAEREEAAVVAERKRRNLAKTELAWLRRGAPARTSKPKARIESAKETINTRPEDAARSGSLPLHAKTPRLGDKVIEVRNVSGGFSGNPPLFDGVDLMLDNRERLGIVGPNGAGKSTLLDIMAGVIEPLAGTVEVGPTAKIGYYDQRGREMKPGQRVRDAIAGDKGEVDWTDKALMEAFWFDSDSQWAPIELLSGGERRRLQLLLTLAEKPNVLLLDEPTNDLDLDTLRELEDFLDEWPGALVVVSHDRAFLERTVADVIVMDGESGVGRLAGGYAAYEQSRRERRGRHRISDGSTERRSRGSATESAPPRKKSGDGGQSPSTVRFKLKAAEKDLRAAQRVLAQLKADFDDALGDHVRLAQISVEVAEAESELARVEEIWLELAETAEELGLKVQ
ncbi:MAG: ABC-F family ATP-binding cassette domain-containing protein [Microthrixaceae bacterium]|nr:ABC-F family ATP-binding cassette domain-containing protein [Microthrixaceae bacterium]